MVVDNGDRMVVIGALGRLTRRKERVLFAVPLSPSPVPFVRNGRKLAAADVKLLMDGRRASVLRRGESGGSCCCCGGDEVLILLATVRGRQNLGNRLFVLLLVLSCSSSFGGNGGGDIGDVGVGGNKEVLFL